MLSQGTPVACKPILIEPLRAYMQRHYGHLYGLDAPEYNRMQKALELLGRSGACRRTDRPGVYLVEASSNPNTWYEVDDTKPSCTCPDHARTNRPCKHMLVIRLHLRGAELLAEELNPGLSIKINTRQPVAV